MSKDLLSFCIPSFSKRYCLGDGNCLFRAFSDQLYQTEEYWGYIRQMVVELMKVYRDELSNFIDESDSPNANFDTYLQKVATNGEWSGDLEIRALSLLYQMPVEIFDRNMKKLKTFHDDHHSKSNPLVFRILWEHNPGHFSSIVKKGRREIFPLSNRKFPGHHEMNGLFKAMANKEIPNALEKIKNIHNNLCQELDIPQIVLNIKISNFDNNLVFDDNISVDLISDDSTSDNTKLSSDELETNSKDFSNISSIDSINTEDPIQNEFYESSKNRTKLLLLINKVIALERIRFPQFVKFTANTSSIST